MVVDCGKDIMTALRIAHGEVLYRDIQYNYGPFSPYIRAAIFKIFGIHLDVIIWYGIFLLFVAVSALFYLANRFLPVLLSFFYSFTFLALCAVSQYVAIGGYNFVIPYASPAVDGFIAGVVSLIVLNKHVEKSSPRLVFLGAVLTAFLFLIKLEIAAASFIAWLFTIGLTRFSMRQALLFASCSLLIPVLVYLFFGFSAGFENLFFNNLLPLHIATAINYKFPMRLLGIEDPARSIEAVLISLLFFTSTVALNVILLRNLFTAHNIKFSVLFLWVGFLIASSFLALIVLDVYTTFKFLPFLNIFVFVYYLRESLKDKAPHPTKVEIIALSVFSTILSLRMFLNFGAYHFGFYLLPFSLLVFYRVIFSEIPEMFLYKKHGSLVENARLSKFYNISMILVLLSACPSHMIVSFYYLRQKSFKLSTERGDLYTYKQHGLVFHEALKYLSENKTSQDYLILFPEATMFNFFASMNQPSYYQSFVPPEIPTKEAEMRVIKDMERTATRFVAIISSNLEPFGSKGFGVDYATEIMDYINQNYSPRKTFEVRDSSGKGTPVFWMHLFVRKER